MDPAINRSGVIACQQRANHKLKHGNALFDQLVNCRISPGQANIAGVLPTRRDRHIAAASELLVALKGAQRRLLPRLITIKRVNDLPAEELVVQHKAPQHRQVVRTKGRSTGRHSGLHPSRVHRHHIGIAFDDHRLVGIGNIPLSLIDAEKYLRLLIQQRLGRIHVFAQFVVLKQLSGAEPNDVPGDGTDRPQQAAVETVDRPLAAHARQPRGLELLEVEALALQVLRQRIPARRREPATELVGMLHCETAIQQELAGHIRPLHITAQLLVIKLKSRFIRCDQPLTSPRLLPTPRSTAFIINAVTDPLRDLLNGLGERDVFHLHQEAEHIPALTRGEAVEIPLVRADVERRRFFVLEGAQSLHRIDATRRQLDILPHDLLDRGCLPNRLNIPLRNPPFCHSHMLVQPESEAECSHLATTSDQASYAFHKNNLK